MFLSRGLEPCLQAALQLAALRCTELLPAACRAPASDVLAGELQTRLAVIRALGSCMQATVAGRQRTELPEKLYRSLSAASEPELRERLLVQALRMLQGLAVTPLAALLAALQARIQQLLCRLPAQEPHTLAALAALVAELQGLHTLPALAVLDLPPHGGITPAGKCATLLHWQRALEQWRWHERYPPLRPAVAALRHCLQHELAGLAQQCLQSDWTLAAYCSKGLQQVLARLQLVEWGSTAAATRWYLQAGELLEMHLDGRAPDPARLQQWFVRLYRRVEQGVMPSANAGAEVPAPGLSRETVAELATWRHLLVQAVAEHGANQPGAGEALLRLLYKPGWVLAELGRLPAARLFRTAWQMLAQYRHLGLQEPPGLMTLLQQLPALLDPEATVTPNALERWQQQLLRLWPSGARNGALGIPLTLACAEDPQLVALAAVPDLLSVSFSTLTQVEQHWFEPEPLSRARRTQLSAELDLLEKGSAALKVWALEELCALLLELHARHDAEGRDAPAALLWQAHRQLLRMLDEAAAWQEQTRDADLLAHMRHWLDGTGERTEPAAAGMPAGLARLQQRLQAWLKSLADVVEKPVRLQVVGAAAALSPALWMQLEAGLKPLLKLLLFDNAADIPTRRALHRPRTSTFVIRFGVCAEGLVVEVDEDSRAPVLDQARLLRLQRTLPGSAGPLGCELLPGSGRRLRFVLPHG